MKGVVELKVSVMERASAVVGIERLGLSSPQIALVGAAQCGDHRPA
jgi:hypothetical protein